MLPRFRLSTDVTVHIHWCYGDSTADIFIQCRFMSGETLPLPDGTPVTVSGTYISTLSDVNGCDSLIFTFATFHGFTAPDITGSTAVNAFHTTGYSVNDVPGHVYMDSYRRQYCFGNGTDSIAVAWQGMGTGIIVVNDPILNVIIQILCM